MMITQFVRLDSSSVFLFNVLSFSCDDKGPRLQLLPSFLPPFTISSTMQAHCFNFMQEVVWSLVKSKVYSKVNSLQCFRAKGEGNIYVKYIHFINQTLAQFCGFLRPK